MQGSSMYGRMGVWGYGRNCAHTPIRPYAHTSFLLIAALAATSLLAADSPPLVVRHQHFFVVVNDAGGAPKLSVKSKGFFTYPHGLALQVIDDRSAVRFQTRLALGAELSRGIPGPSAPRYLVIADPEMNGVIFGVDRPWGIVASASHGMGSSGAVPQMFVYIPPECERFTVTAHAPSPREGGRVTVSRPDGAEALVLDGEFDTPLTKAVTVPADQRGKVWSLRWSKPQTAAAALDDIVVSLDGSLAPLLWKERAWAQKHGPAVWEAHRAATR